MMSAPISTKKPYPAFTPCLSHLSRASTPLWKTLKQGYVCMYSASLLLRNFNTCKCVYSPARNIQKEYTGTVTSKILCPLVYTLSVMWRPLKVLLPTFSYNH